MASPFAFVDAPLDRADALRDDGAALQALWADAGLVLVDRSGGALTNDDGQPWLVTPSDATRHPPAIDVDALRSDAVFLGLRDGRAWFAATMPADTTTGGRTDLRAAATQWPAFEATLFAQARAVLHWRARHVFCPTCAGTLAFSRGGWQGTCTRCGLPQYPRTDPAVIMAVTDGPRLLLGRQPGWPVRRYSTLAGFVEPGETLEQAVAREVFEESAVRVHAARYVASQPWPFPSSLMLGYIADAAPDVPRASSELEDVRWFERSDILAALDDRDVTAELLLSPPTSISRWLIAHWARATQPA